MKREKDEEEGREEKEDNDWEEVEVGSLHLGKAGG